MFKKELLSGLSETQIKRIQKCQSQEEVLALAKEEGIELTEEQLAAVSGGCGTGPACPECGSPDTKHVGHYTALFECQNCGHKF